jgi:hypothetical protein
LRERALDLRARGDVACEDVEHDPVSNVCRSSPEIRAISPQAETAVDPVGGPAATITR